MRNLDIAMESTPHLAQLEKSLHSKEDLAQQKEISKIILKSEMHSLSVFFFFSLKKNIRAYWDILRAI